MARTLGTPAAEEILYLRGVGNDEAYGIAVDPSGAVYLSGDTNTSGFLESTEYHGGTCGFAVHYDLNLGASDGNVYVAKLNPAGAVVWQQSFGGDNYEFASRVALDPQGQVYLTGATASLPGFPTINPLPVSYVGTFGESGHFIAFAAMLTSAGMPVYRTLVAGDSGNGIAVDQDGRAYIATNRLISYDDGSQQYLGVALAIKPNGTAWGYDQPLVISGAVGIALDTEATAYVAVDSAVAKVAGDPPIATTSYYMASVDTTRAYNLGCKARTNGERVW